ncbi:PrgI family protein [Rossellomorea marisflavi]|uniref:PrgI family protein n=1 Tax=Rossellomorea marisflavi TaxID=189381 RepID=UPI003FA12D07
MRMYQVPPDTREKEKVIGGLFDWNQFFWFLAGAGIGIGLFFIVITVTGLPILAGILGLIGISTTLPFVFVKKKDLTLYQYLTFKRKLKKQTGHLINRRKDVTE